MTGKSIGIEMDCSVSTVLDVKRLFQEKEGIPVDTTRFVYNGKQLEDYRLLSDYGRQPGIYRT
jgi:hypothetical protein